MLTKPITRESLHRDFQKANSRAKVWALFLNDEDAKEILNFSCEDFGTLNKLTFISEIFGVKVIPYCNSSYFSPRPNIEKIMQCANLLPAPGNNVVQELAEYITYLEQDRDSWKKKFKDLDRELMCELRDPNGTIWEHAKRLQTELDVLKNKEKK